MSEQKWRLYYSRQDERCLLLSQLAEQAYRKGIPFLWVMGAQSKPPGEMLPVSYAKAPSMWAEFQRDHIFNGYSITHPGGMKALAGDILDTGGPTVIVEYIKDMFVQEIATSVWTNRALSLLYSILFILLWQRDQRGLVITWKSIEESTSLDALLLFTKDEDVPIQWRSQLLSYLKHLPGYENGLSAHEQLVTTREAHFYLQMQIKYVLSGTMRKMTLGAQCVLQTLMTPPGHTVGLGWCIEQWSEQHSNGLILLDEPDRESRLLFWLNRNRAKLLSTGQSVVVAVEKLDGFDGEVRTFLERMQMEQETLSAHAQPNISRL